MPPRGRYLAREVGRLAGVSGNKIGQWARRGYIRSSQSSVEPRVYSYQDAADAMAVHALLDAGVEHAAIREAIEFIRSKRGSSWPLSGADLRVGRRRASGRVEFVLVDAAEAPMDVRSHNLVFEQILDLAQISADLRRGGWAARALPDLRHIEVHPDRLSGRPVIAGLRVPAEDAGRLAETAEGREILRDDYGLTDEQISDAARWWATVTEYDPAA